MKTVSVIVPTMYIEGTKPTINQDGTELFNNCIANGYRVTFMNDYEYKGVMFTHYILEKEEGN